MTQTINEAREITQATYEAMASMWNVRRVIEEQFAMFDPSERDFYFKADDNSIPCRLWCLLNKFNGDILDLMDEATEDEWKAEAEFKVSKNGQLEFKF